MHKNFLKYYFFRKKFLNGINYWYTTVGEYSDTLFIPYDTLYPARNLASVNFDFNIKRFSTTIDKDYVFHCAVGEHNDFSNTEKNYIALTRNFINYPHGFIL